MHLSPAYRAFLRKHLVHGRLRPVARPLYASIVALELGAQRALDMLFPPHRPGDRDLLRHLTAVVKTFERPKALRRLLRSILRMYPELAIIVVDDSQQPTDVPGVQTIVLPYNTGLSAGRREGLRHVRTKYVLILDDDYVFYRYTKLEAALGQMECHPQIDIMGGERVDLPLFAPAEYSQSGLFPAAAPPNLPSGSTIGRLPVYDKVANFFIARTERLRLVDWDPALKNLEHADFFRRARGILTTVFNADLKCLHAPTPFDSAYMEKRTDFLLDDLVLRYRQTRDMRDQDRAQQ
jgi:glycosyltransferase involved in cell wall biosynthesis